MQGDKTSLTGCILREWWGRAGRGWTLQRSISLPAFDAEKLWTGGKN